MSVRLGMRNQNSDAKAKFAVLHFAFCIPDHRFSIDSRNCWNR